MYEVCSRIRGFFYKHVNCLTQHESANEGSKLLTRTDKLSSRQLTMIVTLLLTH